MSEVRATDRGIGRREAIVRGLAGAVALAGLGTLNRAARGGVSGVGLGETPGVEAGRDWSDDQPCRVDVRPDSGTGAYPLGLPLRLDLSLARLPTRPGEGPSPIVGARVDLWGADAQGVYSDSEERGTAGSDSLRGYQLSDRRGRVRFLTNYPGWSPGRTPHLHLRVRVRAADGSGRVAYNFATQLFFDDDANAVVLGSNLAYFQDRSRDTTNATDRVFNGAALNGSPDTEAGRFLLVRLDSDRSQALGAFGLGLDLADRGNEDPTAPDRAGR